MSLMRHVGPVMEVEAVHQDELDSPVESRISVHITSSNRMPLHGMYTINSSERNKTVGVTQLNISQSILYYLSDPISVYFSNRT